MAQRREARLAKEAAAAAKSAARKEAIAQAKADKIAAALVPEKVMPTEAELKAARELLQNDAEVEAMRSALTRRVLSGIPMRWAEDFPHVWLPLPEPWRAGDFAARLRALAAPQGGESLLDAAQQGMPCVGIAGE